MILRHYRMCVVITDDYAIGARQRSLLSMPFDDTAQHGTPHQHRSHHDISRLDVAPNTDSVSCARRSVHHSPHFHRPCLGSFLVQICLVHFAEIRLKKQDWLAKNQFPENLRPERRRMLCILVDEVDKGCLMIRIGVSG